MRYPILIAILILCFNFIALCQPAKGGNSFADHWEFVGISVDEPDYMTWGASPIIGDDGKCHLFTERWPKGFKVDPGWRSHSEVAHYVAEKPEGPFHFSDIALQGTDKATWDKFGTHNPAIHKVGDQFVLLYIANDNPSMPPHPANQCIGMATSKSLYGPWKKVGSDGKILAPPNDSNYWNYKATNGVNNPALFQNPAGGFFLYFKSAKAKMGVAIAQNIEGPYVQLPFPVTSNNLAVEDGYAFAFNGKVALLITDNHGLIEAGGGLLWTSDDGIKFTSVEKGFHRLSDCVEVDLKKSSVLYGSKSVNYARFERPQVLLINGKPAYLYVASGTNIYGQDHTVNFVLKFKN
jgi:hypothetical protein